MLNKLQKRTFILAPCFWVMAPCFWLDLHTKIQEYYQKNKIEWKQSNSYYQNNKEKIKETKKAYYERTKKKTVKK